VSSPDAPSREDRLEELEIRVRRLEEALFAAQNRSVLREAAAEPPSAEGLEVAAAEALPEEARPETSSIVFEVLAQTGWSVLALAGAFLVRALTDRGAMATAPGVALGLSYALGVMVLADRAAARGKRMTGAFLGSTGAFIANAIVAETTTRFAIFTPIQGLGVLAAATAVALALGRRRDLPAVAWTGTLAACATGVFLAAAAHAPVLSGILLLLLAVATAWLATERWTWRLLPWVPTLCAVGLSLWATTDALAPSGARATGVAMAMTLALGLAVLWPGGVFAHALVGRPRIAALEVVQLVLALSVGLGGALRLARAAGGEASLAFIAAASGAGAYAFAFLRERGQEARARRLYFAWLGLALLVIGTGALLRDPAPALLWSVLAVSATAIARHYEPGILQPQGAVLAAAAAAASGLLTTSLIAFTASVAAMKPAAPAVVVALVAVTGAAALLLIERPAAGPLPGFATTLLSALGLGAAAVLLLHRPAGAILAAPLPALRTVVISLSAYVLARLWRFTGRNELRTLAYLALVAGGLKLLIEDLPSGTPLTLFVAFVFYGVALLLVPRTMRAAPAAMASGH
jgi:hypothetical protein